MTALNLLERFGLLRRSAHVAPAGPDDVDAMAAIHAQAFARPWIAEDFAAFLADRSVVVDCLLVGRDRDCGGFALSRLAADEAEVLSVALDKAARGEGHSRQLLASHLSRLAGRGVVRVHLEVEEGNRPALALYRRHGFVQSGVRPGYYTRPDGTRTNALSMTRVAPGGSSTARP